MQLSEAIKRIKENPRYTFELVVEGKPRFGKTNVANAEAQSGSVEDYLIRVAKHNNVERIGVQLFQPNGSSQIRKDFLQVEIPAVVEPTKPVDYTTNIVDEQQQRQHSHKNDMNSIRAEIEAATLKTENTFLKKDNSHLEQRVKDLEAEQKKLLEENRALYRENTTIKDKTEMEWQQKMLTAENGRKSGLDGIVDAVNSNPKIIEAIVGLFPNHPMNRLPQETETVDGVEVHADPDAEACIQAMISELHKQSSESVGMITVVVDRLIKNPKTLEKLYTQIMTPKKEEPKKQED